MVRDPTSEAAGKLRDAGAGKVKLFQGQLTDIDAYKKAAEGTSGIFLNLPDPDPAGDVDSQYLTAKSILDAVKQAGVRRVVASTTLFADQPEKWDNDEIAEIGLRHYFKSKARMEDAVRESGMDWTILHPAWLMGNYILPNAPYVYPELVEKAELAHALAEGRTMSHTDEEDVGRYAAAAFCKPAKFLGQSIDLGNENLSTGQVAELLSKASGKAVATRQRSSEEIGEILGSSTVPAALPFEIFASKQTFKTDSGLAQKQYGIALTSFEDYLQKHSEKLGKSVPP